MSRPSWRLSCLAFIWTTSLASRPEPDEVHIATNGHFVKHVPLDSHHGHRGQRHQSSHTKQHGLVNEAVQEPRVHTHTDLYEDAGLRELHMNLHEEHVPTLSDVDHLELRSQWEQAKRDFYASRDLGPHGELAHNTWYDYIPYMITRVAIIALIIYSFWKGPQKCQDKEEKAMTDGLKEQPPLKDTIEEVGEAAFAASAGEPEADAGARKPACEQTVDERLGQALEDRLYEVERWLRQSVEGLDPTVSDQPELRHYQRRWPEQPNLAGADSPRPTVDIAPPQEIAVAAALEAVEAATEDES